MQFFGDRLQYRVWGTGDPLVCIPGAGLTCDVFDALGRYLENDVSCVGVDHPGVGNSTFPIEGISIGGEATVMADFCQATFRQPVTVVGHSFGGFVALTMARRFPALVHRVVLLGSAHCWCPPRRFTRPLQNTAHVPPVVQNRGARVQVVRHSLLVGVADDFPQREPKRFEALVSQQAAAFSSADLFGAQLSVARHFCLPRPEALTQPVLVISGQADRLIPWEHARETATRFPRGEFVRLPNTGHFPHYERPEVVGEAIVAFLAPAVFSPDTAHHP